MKDNLLFIYKPPKKFNIIIFAYIIFLTLLLLYIFSHKIYSKKILKGIVSENQIVIPINYLDSKIVSKSNFIKIDNRRYNLDVLEVSEIYNDGNVNIQDLKIKFNNKNYFDNQVIEVTFYYEYDYIIKKIVRGVLE